LSLAIFPDEKVEHLINQIGITVVVSRVRIEFAL